MISALEVLRDSRKTLKRHPRGRGRPRSLSAHAVILSEVVKKRKQWTDEAMLSAMTAVKNGMNVTRAATIHGVPRITLHDMISGRVAHGTKSGPAPYLSPHEEKEFSIFIEQTAKVGYGKSRKQIKKVAGDVAHDKGLLDKGKSVSDGWYHGFMKRQSHLSLRKGDPIANVRMECLDKEAMEEYFQLLKSTLTEHNLLNKPNRIYNVDETGMPLDHKPPKVMTTKGQKKVRCRTTGNKAQVTVIACVSASGHTIPPFVIFDAKTLNIEWTKGEIPGTRYGLSNTGWVDTYLFKKWLKDHFLEHAVGGRPLLLILDGHGSHYQPELIQYARENNVILFCLPPHTTHESQPLDTCVFKPLKQNWQEACHHYIQANPGKIVTKYTFSALLNEAWGKTMVPNIISSGFKRSGIYPFNPNAIEYGMDESMLEKQLHNETSSLPTNTSGATEHSEKQQQKSFSADQEKLYKRRYEENYNLPDPEYLEWLKINHPSEYISNLDASQKDRDTLQSNSDNELQNTQQQEFDNKIDRLIPQQEVPIISVSFDALTFSDSLLSSSASVERTTLSQSVPVINEPDLSPHASSPTTSQLPPVINTPSHLPTIVTPVVPIPEHEGELRYISKYLIQYVPVKQRKISSTGKRATGARVLTNDECAQILAEQQEKKQKDLEEKEKRKADREQKKRKKEEEARHKAEKKKEADRKRAENKRKTSTGPRNSRTQKRSNSSSSSLSAKKRNTNTYLSNCPSTSATFMESESLASTPAETVSTGPEPQLPNNDSPSIVDLDSNQCCVCLEMYDATTEWVQCACQRWLHEDCYSDVILDKYGRELLCPFCVP